MTQTHTHVLEGTLTPAQSLTYPLLPFEVPAHTERIEVSYHYSGAIGSDPHLTGGSTIDIGIFDPRGSAFMGTGFRGWSGSARTMFFLAATEATPGYMPGPLPEGMWNICLGAYKVAQEGCDYQVNIEITTGDVDIHATFPPRLQLSAEPRPDMQKASGWYKGELHCHTYHSDGDSDPADVVRRAEALGLDFLAITDHNNLSHQVALASVNTLLMLIPGIEVTTYKGHWNIWGAGPWIDFRVLSEQNMQTAVNAAVAAGYLVSCNHPRPFGPEWVYPEVTGFNCIEVWNGPWPVANDVALAYWDRKLQGGGRFTAVGGSDCHYHKIDHPAKLAQPTMFIFCGDAAPSPVALLAGIRAGHAFVTEGPDGPELYLSAEGAMMGDTIRPRADRVEFTMRARNAQGKTLQIVTMQGVAEQLLVADVEWQRTIEVKVDRTPYVRAVLTSGDMADPQVHSVTNPIYIEPASR